jgi:stage III sporulation protein AA
MTEDTTVRIGPEGSAMDLPDNDTAPTPAPTQAADLTSSGLTPSGQQETTADNPNEIVRDGGEHVITDDLDALLDALPPTIISPLKKLNNRVNLLEVVMDLGRRAEARYHGSEHLLTEHDVTQAELDYVIDRIGEFGGDNRAGIERTLHRISCIRNRRGNVVGLTCRIGRAVYGTISIIKDLVETGKSILLVGPPGVGKTTLLRECARVLSDEVGKRVVIVDTSNEIAGDGDIPHPSIGRARRMQVPQPERQHAVMIEAVENHMPEVIIIDEIGTELEAQAARTIAERGVQLVGTAHGSSLENLMLNPTLSDLVGGIQPVTLGDEEARRRGTQKTVLERKAPPTFDIMVEILDRERVAVHRDVAETVDSLLRGEIVPPEIRTRLADGSIHSEIARGLAYGGDSGMTMRRDSGRRGPGGQDDRFGSSSSRRGISGPQSPSMRRDRPYQGSSSGYGSSQGGRPQRGNGGGFSPFGRELAEERIARRAGLTPSVLTPSVLTPSVLTPSGPATAVAEEEMPELSDKELTPSGRPEARSEATPGPGRMSVAAHASENKPLQVYPFGVSRNRLEQAIKGLRVPATIVRDMSDADIVMTLKNYYRKNPQVLRQAEQEGVPVFVLKSNTQLQIESALGNVFNVQPPTDPFTEAMEETEAAITQVLETSRPVELAPQASYIRRLQHQMAERYNLGSTSKGKEPFRRVRIYRQDQ